MSPSTAAALREDLAEQGFQACASTCLARLATTCHDADSAWGC